MPASGVSLPLMQAIDAPVTTALILVCEKCGKRLGTKHEDNVSRILASRLKQDAKRDFGKKAVRTVLTSCLDVCPKDRVTVAIVSTALDGPSARFIVIDPSDLEDASHAVLKHVRRTSRP